MEVLGKSSHSPSKGCDVVAVVLNWRTAQLTEQCVRSLQESQFDGTLTIIVIDNDSRDGSAERLENSLKGINLIRTDENRGYAGGMNVGLRSALQIQSKYAVLLNADITLEKDALQQLYIFAEKYPAGAIFGPRIFDFGGPRDEWLIGGRWDWFQGTVRIVRGRASRKSPLEPQPVEFINGSAMFVRMQAIERVGMFDERFGLYFEETDLCSRMQRAGYTLWYVPQAVAYHVCGASIAKAKGSTPMDLGQYYRTRNRMLWGRKNLTGLKAVVFWWNIAWRLPCKLIILLATGQIPRARGLARGVLDFARKRFGLVHIDTRT